MTPLELAIWFHDTYERLAPSHGYETRLETRNFDPESKNGKLMVAVCTELLAVQYVTPRDPPDFPELQYNGGDEYNKTAMRLFDLCREDDYYGLYAETIAWATTSR